MKDKYCKTGILILFFVSVCLFFGILYPQHIHFQEQQQLFLWQSDYVTDVLFRVGGIADLSGRFLTQFFHYRWPGAIIIALLLTLVAVLMMLLMRSRFYALSFVPSMFLWRVMCDHNSLVGAIISVILLLLACCAIVLAKSHRQRIIISAIAIPVLIIMAGTFNTSGHYFRSAEVSHAYLWWAVASIPVIFIISRIWSWEVRKPFIVPLLSFAICGGMGYTVVRPGCDFVTEEILSYYFMMRTGQWNRILFTAQKTPPTHTLSIAAVNLALEKKGQLSDCMFQYPQVGLEGLLPSFEGNAVTPLFTSEIYYQLGLTRVAQCHVFEAQEAIPDYQKSAWCYQRLAETNMINGNYAVARKYLYALHNTLFYADWATKMMHLIDNPKSIDAHSEYGTLRKTQIDRDIFFNSTDVTEVLDLACGKDNTNNTVFDYLQAALLLNGNLDKFVANLNSVKGSMPVIWQQAKVLWWSGTHTVADGSPKGVSPEIDNAIKHFYRDTQSVSQQTLHERYGQTYWYYYFSLKTIL